MTERAGHLAAIASLTLLIWLIAKPRASNSAQWSIRLPFPKRQRRTKGLTDLELAMFLVGLQTQVAAGSSLTAALANQALDHPDNFPNTATAIRNRADIAPAFTIDAQLQDQQVFSGLATLVGLAQQTGASVDSALTHLANQELMARDEQRLLESELAATRATVKILTALPLFGLAMVSLIDFEVLRWLLSTGRPVFLSGLLLIGLGFIWLNRIVRKALR